MVISNLLAQFLHCFRHGELTDGLSSAHNASTTEPRAAISEPDNQFLAVQPHHDPYDPAEYVG